MHNLEQSSCRCQIKFGLQGRQSTVCDKQIRAGFQNLVGSLSFWDPWDAEVVLGLELFGVSAALLTQSSVVGKQSGVEDDHQVLRQNSLLKKFFALLHFRLQLPFINMKLGRMSDRVSRISVQAEKISELQLVLLWWSRF
uniref:Uncharacterized protein n=1 Tax=Spironucleus salmonicida TaxID=348837 RepID=V6LLI7_9EUKA|eukprot:EST45530.1 Hypothetical protein SS50377_14532 [Spironucleus salmonicida]